MELDPNDYDVVKLLTKLKSTDGAYPSDLLTPRRQTYIRRVAEMGLGFGVAAGLKPTIKTKGNGRGSSSVAGGLIEAVLLVVIVAEAGAAAYLYRDQISALIQSYVSNPKIVESTTVPATEFSPILPEFLVTNPPEGTPTPTPSATPSGTPISATAAANSGNTGNQGNSTPDPNGNNGNHFGQTPRPERTVGPDNDNNDTNNGNSRDN